jgi:tRNA threonylcarbamoyladenosine biosynthesis protein TsaB
VKILGLDTALGALSVAVLEDGAVRAHAFREMARGHAEELAPMVERLLREAKMTPDALDRIAVTTGPGTFTGQRVGLAFARAFGLALKRPVIGVTSLDAMAEEALAKVADAAWAIAAADAKRGEIYLGARSREGGLIAPELIALTDAPARLAQCAAKEGRAVVLAGTAAEMLLPLLQAAGLTPRDSQVRQPDAVFVARLAAHVPAGPPPKPLYLRPPDAKLPAS